LGHHRAGIDHVESERAGLPQGQPVVPPSQIFQINEPIFFGFPIVLNPIFMIPYILSALTLTTATYLLMGHHQQTLRERPLDHPPISAIIWSLAAIESARLGPSPL
jgi:PTS system cellobiose-specific IIC component